MRNNTDSSFLPAAEVSGFQIGQHVHLAGSEAEFIVIDVDRDTGRLELLRLSPGRIEADVPAASVRLSDGIHLVRGADGK